MKNPLFLALLIFSLFLFAQRAEAVYYDTPTVPGLNAGNYKPLTPGQLTGNNFPAAGKVMINGRPTTIPGYVPLSPSAPDYAKRGLFNNPWLLGPALLLWPSDLGNGDLHLTPAADDWVYTPPQPDGPLTPPTIPVNPATAGCRSSDGGATVGYCDATMQACITNYAPLISGRTCVAYADGQKIGAYNDDPTVYTGPDAWRNPDLPPYGECPEGKGFKTGTTQCAPLAVPRPAVEDDFMDLPPPPPEVYEEMAPQIGVPVDSPVYDPVDVPLGNPYTRPDGSSAQTRAKVSPMPDGQVAIDVYDQPLTNPDGSPVPQNTPPEDKEETPPDSVQCDKYPESLGCANLDRPNAEPMDSETRDISLISPVAVGGAGSCPAPLTGSFLGNPIEFSFDPLCTYATSLRPLVLALAWLSGGLIFIGGVKNG